MAEVAAFRAIRYEAGRLGGDLTGLLAPPYDVLERSDKEALLATNDRNIVAIDLPHLPPKSEGPPQAYAESARRLAEWRKDGTLCQDPEPALYAYHQRFAYQGRDYTRRMFIAAVRLRAFDEGVILPHERTFGGPKEDRLALMKATRCALSPIFGLYDDPEDEIGGLFAAAVRQPPTAQGTVEDVENRLWRVTDSPVIESVRRRFQNRRIYIADGHHRYGTALMFRDWMRAECGGGWSEDHPANYVMFVLVSMNDPGCLVLPYYRTLGEIDLDSLLRTWRPGVRVVEERSTADLVLHDGRSGREVGVQFSRRDALDRLAVDQGPAWRKLDYAYLHRYLIEELLAKTGGSPPAIHYLKSREAAVRAAKEESGVALLVKATPMAHLRAVAEAGGLMPQKSTYFYPKLATGMTLMSLQL